MQEGVCEYGEDIFEENALLREIGKLTDGAAESHLKTGEFGGAGGGSGGDPGRSGGDGGIGNRCGWVRGGGMVVHDEEKERSSRREGEGRE